MLKVRLFVNLTRLLVASVFITSSALAADVVATPTAEAVKPVVVPAYELVKDKSSLKFIATQNNAPVEGKFSAFDADILFDPDHLDLSHIRVEVDLNSLSLADSQTQATLLSADWLSVAEFPKAVFDSEKLDKIPSTNDYYAKGMLSLRGIKAPATINFIIEYSDDTKIVASGSATIQRTEFGVGQKEWAKDDVIKKSVRVEFRVTANKKL
jgi:polyisoprenoid-binding protein YceI